MLPVLVRCHYCGNLRVLAGSWDNSERDRVARRVDQGNVPPLPDRRDKTHSGQSSYLVWGVVLAYYSKIKSSMEL